MKYKLRLDLTTTLNGKTLYRIEALKSFNDVNVGDLGGFIESERNLSHEGNAWVSGNAWVYGDAWVFGNAKVYGDAWVFGNAKVYDIDLNHPSQLVNITNFTYPITITYSYVRVGCKHLTLDEVGSITYDSVAEGVSELEFEVMRNTINSVLNQVLSSF